MSAYLLIRRILLVIPMLFGVVTLTFFVTHVLPGDPTYSLVGPLPTEEQIQVIRETYGFDKPIYVQYWDYLKGVVQLDFGKSLFTDRTVAYDIGQRLPSTIELVSLSLLFALMIGLPLGFFAARLRGKSVDKSMRIYSFIFLATPEFWFALMALYIFFFLLGIAPAPVGQLGVEDPEPHRITGAALWDSILTANWDSFKPALAHLAVPVITYGLVLSAPISRLMRSSTLEVLEADYIRFARSCGVGRVKLWRYAIRASLPPVVTYAAIIFAILVGNAVIVENIFSWGGAAQYAGEAILRNDFNPVQGFVLVTGVISVVVFLIVDLLYVLIDPRVKL